MTSSEPNKWKSLANTDEDSNIIIDDIHNSLYAISKSSGLCEYDRDTDTWNKHPITEHLGSKFFEWKSVRAIAIDSQQNMYVWNGTDLIILQLKDKTYDKFSWVSIFNEGGLQGIILGDEFHVIGGNNDMHLKHRKWNGNFQLFDKLHDLKFAYPQIVKLKDKLISFGGFAAGDFLDEINEYDIINDKWSKFEITLPRAMMIDGAALVLKQQFIILFGGVISSGVDDANHIDNIWIYSVRDKKFTESKMKCPWKMGGKVLAMNNPKDDEFTVFGYIRSQWRECRIHDQLFPPRYLIKIMNKYYLNEWIHLIDKISSKHWKINVSDIINNI